MDHLFHPSKRLYWHTLSHKFHHEFQARHHFHAYTVIGLTTVIFFLAFLIARSLPQSTKVLGETTTALATEVIVPPSIPSPRVGIISPKPSPIPKNLVYYVKLTPKNNATMSGFLADELVLALNLPLVANQTFPIKALVIDTLGTTPSARFNGTYVAVIDAATTSINPTTLYESPSAYVSVQPAPTSLLPYVLNKSFCSSSQDCIRRESACLEGAYNRFEPFADNNYCHNHVSVINATPSACVISPTCLANRCQLINSCT